MGTVKHALAIRKNRAPESIKSATNLDIHPLTAEFFATGTFLADRAVCETDNSILQLLPYVILRRDAGIGEEVFMYTRGDGGEEARLHGAFSIGVGGHVDTQPMTGESLEDHLKIEAVREVKEEVGLDIPFEAIHFVDLVYDHTTEVGRCHLGIIALVRINEDVGQLEAGQIKDGRWVPIADLLAPETFERLEPWSKIAAQFLNGSD